MNKVFLLLLVFLLGNGPISSQAIEEDNMVLYMKANVLFESGRYDEAVRMYNRILAEDATHSKALFMRSKAKYELGAYKGTKNDILKYIEMSGVTKDVIKLMANTEFKLSNLETAQNYSYTALELDPYDDKMHLLSGDISIESGSINEACESYALSAQLGNLKAGQRLEKTCLGIQPRTRTNDQPSQQNDKMGDLPEDTEVYNEDVKESGEIVTLEDIVRDAEISSGPSRENEIDITTTQNIEIDSKLNIVVSNGLGDRRLTSKPSIFMLSDQDGIVVIDLCVDEDGKVIEANFNRAESTIYRSSLTSLALRKAREFVFERSNSAEQCGAMSYHIKS